MEKHTNEQLSALMDGALHGSLMHQALERLRQDEEWQGAWRRYHLINDTLHGNLGSAQATDLHLRVQAALEREPTLLAPRRRERLPMLAKQAAGLAIAASVAAVAIIAIQHDEVPAGGTEPIAVAQALRPANDMVQLASTGAPAVVIAEPAVRGRLQAYLVNHNEYAVSSGMQGVLPYVRIVSNEKAK